MVVLTILLVQPVKGLVKMVAARRSADDNAGPVSQIMSGAARIIT